MNWREHLKPAEHDELAQLAELIGVARYKRSLIRDRCRKRGKPKEQAK